MAAMGVDSSIWSPPSPIKAVQSPLPTPLCVPDVFPELLRPRTLGAELASFNSSKPRRRRRFPAEHAFYSPLSVFPCAQEPARHFGGPKAQEIEATPTNSGELEATPPSPTALCSFLALRDVWVRFPVFPSSFWC